MNDFRAGYIRRNKKMLVNYTTSSGIRSEARVENAYFYHIKYYEAIFGIYEIAMVYQIRYYLRMIQWAYHKLLPKNYFLVF